MTNIADTIAAVATAPGLGGIGIVRISGSLALPIINALFIPANALKKPGGVEALQPPFQFQHQRLHYGYLLAPGQRDVIDEVLVAYMRAPHSYTREDVVEIQSHAGSAVLQRILSEVVSAGARLADPGEFTRRAFLNGRIDLSQAEAVADIISAKTDKAMELASRQLTGGMRQRIGYIRERLQEAAGHLEAGIEFPDEVSDETDPYDHFREATHSAQEEIWALLNAYHRNHIYMDGIEVSVVGRPNVGKSSLLNALLERERAIVTALPGTTRDLVIDSFQVDGVPIQISDTAGLRCSDDIIEQMGIQKTEESIATAHLVLFVLDTSERDHAEDKQIYSKLRKKNLLVVINKSDLLTVPPELPRWVAADTPHVSVSAKYRQHIEALKKKMVAQIRKTPTGSSSDTIAPNLRQKIALEKAMADISSATAACQAGESDEFIVFHLQSAMNGLGTITGETHSDDLLDVIFDRFCIGK